MLLYEELQALNECDKTVNESNEVKRALYGDYRHKIKTFGIFTAENPMGKELTPQENNERTSKLKQYFSKMHLQYVPILGRFDVEDVKKLPNYGDSRYGGKYRNRRYEHSFVVINISLDEAKQLCSAFDQLSFFFGENYWGESVPTGDDETAGVDKTTTSKISYYEWDKKSEEYRVSESSRRVDNAQDFDNFFSRHGDFKYSIYMNIFNESYNSFHNIVDIDYLNEALAPKRTFIHRSMQRYHAYHGFS